MGRAIRIQAGEVSLAAELNDSPTADAVWQALPVEATGNRWGDEIYFAIPVSAKRAPEARAEVEVGELGYWPPGKALCIFFGPTPASQGKEPRAASPINPIGRVLDDVGALQAVPDGARVHIAKGAE